MLLWLWCRPAATAPIRPLAWEPPYAAGVTQEMAKRQKGKKERKKERNTTQEPALEIASFCYIFKTFSIFLINDFFFHYSWFVVFYQFSTVQQGDPVTHTYILFSHIITLHHECLLHLE